MLAWLGGAAKLRKRQKKGQAGQQRDGGGVGKKQRVDSGAAPAQWRRGEAPAPSNDAPAGRSPAPALCKQPSARVERAEHQASAPPPSYDLLLLGGLDAVITSSAAPAADCGVRGGAGAALDAAAAAQDCEEEAAGLHASEGAEGGCAGIDEALGAHASSAAAAAMPQGASPMQSQQQKQQPMPGAAVVASGDCSEHEGPHGRGGAGSSEARAAATSFDLAFLRPHALFSGNP